MYVHTHTHIRATAGRKARPGPLAGVARAVCAHSDGAGDLVASAAGYVCYHYL